MNNIKNLQLILGTDKKNPIFSLYKKDANTLYILYGAELLSIVSLNTHNFERKIIIGILYNSGVKVKSLVEAFSLDKKTIKKIGDALKLDSPEETISILRGRENKKKLTEEVQAYIKMRFPTIYEGNKYSYSKAVLGEIKEIFGKEISSETIRPLLKELKASYTALSKKEEPICDLNTKEMEAKPPLPLGHENKAIPNKELVIENAESVCEPETVHTNNRKDMPPESENSGSSF